MWWALHGLYQHPLPLKRGKGALRAGAGHGQKNAIPAGCAKKPLPGQGARLLTAASAQRTRKARRLCREGGISRFRGLPAGNYDL
ncbi:hypothetical protein DESPIG_01848 [Desulfovibrio piger ATCC 29098]|uniref:Uncharacterized protein n=1 Tax=Desulfovibrio piger ATCC 29098 TaxID=411464 RepID=B6WUT7_9BACT|nr:hypothetical protein DESPIG_01848 [Desulfovibrio piger ATCC 29098]